MLEELLSDEELRRKFVGEVAVRLADDPNMRVLLLNSLITGVATKRDLDLLKADLNKKVDYVSAELNRRIDDVRTHMRTYFFGSMGGMLATIITVVITKLI